MIAMIMGGTFADDRPDQAFSSSKITELLPRRRESEYRCRQRYNPCAGKAPNAPMLKTKPPALLTMKRRRWLVRRPNNHPRPAVACCRRASAAAAQIS
jgi:hypothetical protein